MLPRLIPLVTWVLCVLASVCVCATPAHQPRTLVVDVRAGWSPTPLLVEAGELHAAESADEYYVFLGKVEKRFREYDVRPHADL